MKPILAKPMEAAADPSVTPPNDATGRPGQDEPSRESEGNVVYPGTEESATVGKAQDMSPALTNLVRRVGRRWKQKTQTLKAHHHEHHARYTSPPQVKSSRLRSIAEGVFVSRELAPKDNRDKYIGYFVREMAIYAIYICIILLLALGSRSQARLHFVDYMFNTFVSKPFSSHNPTYPTTFATSTRPQDFWNYMTIQFPESLYGEDNRTGMQVGALFQNTLVGVPRLRQVRVRRMDCALAENFRHARKDCYPAYTETLEDKGDAKTHRWDHSRNVVGVSLTKDAWLYRSEEELGGIKYATDSAVYGGGGGIQLLRKVRNETEEIVKLLKGQHWVDRGTRAMFLEFTLYNANTNLFCDCGFVWEFLPTGGVKTSWTFRTVTLFRSQLDWYHAYVVFTSYIFLGLYILYFIAQEVFEFLHNGFKEYFFDVYTWIDLTIIVSNIATLFLRAIVFSEAYETADRLKPNGGSTDDLKADGNFFHDFAKFSYYRHELNDANAISIFFALLKVFKYISFNKTMIQLSATLSKCAKDFAGFTLVFFVVLFAFGQLGYLIFGPEVLDFNTYEDSVFTLIRLNVGEFNFNRNEATNRILGPIFFLTYIFFVFFVLQNMFLAIIMDTYSEVKAEIQARRNEFEISDYICRSINNLFGLFGRRNVHMDAVHAVKLAPPDGQLTYADIFKSLKRAHFTDIEIKTYLAKFGLKREGHLVEEDTQKILNYIDDLKRRSQISTATLGETNQEVTKKKLARLQRCITELQFKLTR